MFQEERWRRSLTYFENCFGPILLFFLSCHLLQRTELGYTLPAPLEEGDKMLFNYLSYENAIESHRSRIAAVRLIRKATPQARHPKAKKKSPSFHISNHAKRKYYQIPFPPPLTLPSIVTIKSS